MSAYRSAASTDPNPRVLLCAACGDRIRVAGDDPECQCRRCGLRQTTSRADEEWTPRELSLVESDDRNYGELVDFCASLGRNAKPLSMTVDVDGVQCVVSLSLNSGTATGLELQARTFGLPPMKLSREDDGDRQAKEAGVAREVQLGDEAFDREVYIDAELADRNVLTFLSPPAVRAAVRFLLKSFPSIKIEGELISLTGYGDEPDCYRPEVVKGLLAALRVLAGAPRPTEVEFVPRSEGAAAVLAFAWAFGPASLAAIIAAGHYFLPVHPAPLFLLGLPAGIALWMIAQRPFRRALSGRSSSHRELVLTGALTSVAFPLTVVAALLVINGAFDRSPERVSKAKVTHTSYDDEDGVTHLEARGDFLDVDFHVSGRGPQIGDEVTFWTKSGLLGLPWPTRPMEVRTTAGTLTER